jgi:hypothetical protein
MIIVYSTKQFDRLVKSKSKNKLQLSLKAKLQPRRKDGRFATPAPKPAALEKNPLVAFDYPRSDAPWISKTRIVRLISTTATHITGLEQVGDSWKFKKFLKPKAKSMQVLSFNPGAMS